MAHAQNIFFIGKGGVGKTTCSVSTAVNLADLGKRVLLVSLDPAHNAGDALEVALSEKKVAITPTLDALEINVDRQIQRYLQRTAETLKHTYRYLTVINLDSLLDVIRHSPGIEEYATLEALHDIFAAEAAQYDMIIFDTAPTGLTLRVLALPSVSLLWIQKLSEIRKKILGLRSAVANIHGEQVFQIDGISETLATDTDTDQVMHELRRYRGEITHTQQILTDPNVTSVVAVLNAEDLPLLETQRVAETLQKFRIPLRLLIMNKILHFRQTPPEMETRLKKQHTLIQQTRRMFAEQTMIEAAWQPEEPRGLMRLRQFCPEVAEFFCNGSERGTR